MKNIQRILNFHLRQKQSAFLWGPRKTGKSTFLKQQFPNSLVYDFLDTDLFLAFSKRPALLREELLTKDSGTLKHPVILDEVQKVPLLLNEVHWMIENKGFSFILCGSSPRKLKRGRANLLGGRAWRYEMFPFVSPELPDLDLLRALNHGLIPLHYLQDNYKKSLKAYVRDYLKEEVFDEGLIRNIPAFSRFFDSIGYAHGELTNYSNIARECGVSSKTVKEYYQILVDTMLGFMVEPYKKRQSRHVLSKIPKFYLFDCGVAGIITKRHIEVERGADFGKALEHFMFTELNAYRSYHDLDFEIHYWRTKTGLEVDFILGDGEVAIEVKGTACVASKDLRPLNAFIEEYSPKKAICVSNDQRKRLHGDITIIPWRAFLKDLWSGKIIK